MAAMQSQKLLRPDDPRAPKYWMHETSGVLEPVVMAYLQGDELSAAQIPVMRAYLWQWVQSPVWGGGGVLEALRVRVAAAKTHQDIEDCIRHAEEIGMDPL